MVSPFPISIPLLLNSEELWNNRTQQSLRFSKPLNVEYVKESTEHILKEKHDIDGQMDKLETCGPRLDKKFKTILWTLE